MTESPRSRRARCSCCSGELPADPNAHAEHLVNGGYCPGHLSVDATGQVVGCGAWTHEAYVHCVASEERDDEETWQTG